jgi:hypothetical protein
MAASNWELSVSAAAFPNDNRASRSQREIAAAGREPSHSHSRALVASRLRDAPSPESLAFMPPDRAAHHRWTPGTKQDRSKPLAFWTTRGCVARAPLRALEVRWAQCRFARFQSRNCAEFGRDLCRFRRAPAVPTSTAFLQGPPPASQPLRKRRRECSFATSRQPDRCVSPPKSVSLRTSSGAVAGERQGSARAGKPSSPSPRAPTVDERFRVRGAKPAFAMAGPARARRQSRQRTEAERERGPALSAWSDGPADRTRCEWWLASCAGLATG